MTDPDDTSTQSSSDKRFQQLLASLKDADPEVRFRTAQRLGYSGDKRAVEPLISMLDDQGRVGTGFVSMYVAIALGQLGDRRAVEPLIRTLEHADDDTRYRAAEALGRIGDRRAVESLITALEDDDAQLRQQAALSLGQIGDIRALASMIAAFHDPDQNVKRAAVYALGGLGTPALQPLLETLWGEDKDLRVAAARALGSLGDEQAIEPLIAMLGDDDVGSEAADSLVQLGGVALQRLIDVLKDGDKRVRGWAAAALAEAVERDKLGDRRAVEPLRALLNDEDSDVRRTAACALRLMGYWPSTPAELRKDAYVSVINTDYHQFLISDSLFDGNTADNFWDIGPERRLAIDPPSLVGVSTKRQCGAVPFAVEIYDGAPENDFEGWDHVEEVSLAVPSGGITIAELMSYTPGSQPQVTVQPGTYRMRVYCGNLDDGTYRLDDDYYRIVLWLAPYEEPLVLRASTQP